MKNAIAFDFDGTLVQNGLDKGIHIMSAAAITDMINNVT